MSCVGHAAIDVLPPAEVAVITAAIPYFARSAAYGEHVIILEHTETPCSYGWLDGRSTPVSLWASYVDRLRDERAISNVDGGSADSWAAVGDRVFETACLHPNRYACVGLAFSRVAFSDDGRMAMAEVRFAPTPPTEPPQTLFLRLGPSGWEPQLPMPAHEDRVPEDVRRSVAEAFLESLSDVGGPVWVIPPVPHGCLDDVEGLTDDRSMDAVRRGGISSGFAPFPDTRGRWSAVEHGRGWHVCGHDTACVAVALAGIGVSTDGTRAVVRAQWHSVAHPAGTWTELDRVDGQWVVRPAPDSTVRP
jgi:hypothetical protein